MFSLRGMNKNKIHSNIVASW